MPDRPSEAAAHTYLVEHYHPGVRVGELKRAVADLRKSIAEMQHEGRPVSYVSSTIVPGDDYLHCVVRAHSEQLVRDVLARAEITYQRISTAIWVAS
jgi:hypothetical protein